MQGPQYMQGLQYMQGPQRVQGPQCMHDPNTRQDPDACRVPGPRRAPGACSKAQRAAPSPCQSFTPAHVAPLRHKELGNGGSGTAEAVTPRSLPRGDTP